MGNQIGKLLFVLLAAVLLSVLGAWLVAWRFRATMKALMRAPVPTNPATAAAPADAAPPVPSQPPQPLQPLQPLHHADNRRAGRHVAALLVALSALIALSSAALYLGLLFDGLLTPGRLLTLAFLELWPVIPVLGTLWRWPAWRTLAVLLGWALIAFAVVRWRSIEPPTAWGIVQYLAVLMAQPMLLYGLLALGSTTRAVAPWLLLPLAGLVWASVAGIDLLDALVTQRAPLLVAAVGTIGAWPLLLGFVALPWLLAWWPLKALGRALAAAYERRWLSELMVLFAALWGITLGTHALESGHQLGPGALAMLLPLLWIPLVLAALGAWRRRPAGRAPVLLVLRVFQRDRAMRALYDAVIERWRLSGNTLLIAGTDLVERTLDAADIFAFIDGRLEERFIRRVEEIPARVGALQFEPDADGRHRVDEFYCHDGTWRETLAALLVRSDVVLMDLRSFQQRHAGCRHELGALARAPGLQRVVLLTDAQTDRGAAEAAAAGGPPGRFVWIDAARIEADKRRAVLRALFSADAAPAG